MSSLISIIVNGLIKAIFPQSIAEPKLLYKAYNNLAHVVTLLMVTGILLSSIFLVAGFVTCYYFFEQGYSVYQLFGIALSVMVTLLLALVGFLWNDMNKIKQLISPSLEKTEQRHYTIISSFMDGFNSK